MRRVLLLMTAFALLAGPGVLHAQATDQDRIQKLEQQIAAMQARMQAMQAKLEAQPAGPGVEGRVQALEKKLDDLAVADPATLRAYWKHGLHMETADGNFKVRIGGRALFDFVWWEENEDIESFASSMMSADVCLESGVLARSARLFASGTIYERIKYKAEYEFGSGNSELDSNGDTYQNNPAFTDI